MSTLARFTERNHPVNRARLAMLVCIGLLVIYVLPAAAQEDVSAQCSARFVEVSSVQGGFAADVSLDCSTAPQAGMDAQLVPLETPVLLGLSLQEYIPSEWNDGETIDVDLPVQVIALRSAAPSVTRRFRLPRAPGIRIEQVQIAVWPLSALRSCDSARDGCQKYGYALGDNGYLSSGCTDDDGNLVSDGCFEVASWYVEPNSETQEPTP